MRINIVLLLIKTSRLNHLSHTSRLFTLSSLFVLAISSKPSMPLNKSSPILRRKTLKRTFDFMDSPVSSTPPRAQRPRQSIPSDSPTNPFGPFSTFSSNSLPRPTPLVEHIVLRFQLDAGGNRNVHRIVQLPSNYSFWHLHKLILFLFAWKETHYNKHEKMSRDIEHQFLVQKEVTMWAASHRVGFVKGGRTWVTLGYLSQEKDTSKKRRLFGNQEESLWELESSFTLRHAWPRGEDPGRSVTYVRILLICFILIRRLTLRLFLSSHRSTML